MHAVALHELVPVDYIFSNHVQKVAEVGRPVGKRRAGMHDPILGAALAPVELVVVELVGHEGQDLAEQVGVSLALGKLRLQLEETKRVALRGSRRKL